jgi:hypothetical protein
MSKGKILRKTITDMIKEIKQSRGAYEAKRLERAADEVPNLGRLYKKDALEGLFRGDNARGIMTMRPGDFERYASPLNYDPKSPKHFMFGEMIDPSKGSTPKGLTQEQYLRYLAGLKGFSDVPFLEAKKLEGKKPKLAIAGHEGRHRSRALDAAGEQAGLVQFYPRASLREEFPRRHRDEYIDALREELEKHGRMVTPESDGSIIRPDIELPDVYKGGGAVRKAAGGKIARKVADMAAELVKKKAVLPREEAEANLKKFLAKSQVKEPVFHASKADVKQFSPKHRTELSGMGHHFGTADQANFRTTQYDFDSKSPNIGKYYLNIENPLEVSHMASFAPDHLAEQLMDMNILKPEAYDAISAKHNYDNIAIGDELVKILRKNGYDGLKYANEREGKGFSFVPFNSNHIKSAIGNEGTYDTSVPDLSKAEGGAVRKTDGGIMEAIEAAKMAGKPRSRPIAGPRQRIDIEQMRREVEENARRVREVRSELTPPAEVKPAYEPALKFLPKGTPESIRYGFEKAFRDAGPSMQVAQVDGKPFGVTSESGGFVDALGSLGGLSEISSTAAGEEVFTRTGSPALAAAAYTLFDPIGAVLGAPAAGKAAIKGAKALAPKMGDLAEQYMMKTGMALPIIKEGGGNWMTGDVARGLMGLKRNELSLEDMALERSRIQAAGTEYKGDPNYIAGQIRRLDEYERDALTNKLIDKQIANYVKNQMGTKDDPIRLAADAFPAQKAKLLAEKQFQIDKATADMEKARQSRGFTPEMMTRSQARIRALEKERELIERREGMHYKPYEIWQSKLTEKRIAAGMPSNPLGQTENARNWEDIVDRKIDVSEAKDWTEGSLYPEPLASNPWLHKVDPESKVYVPRDLEHDFGFDHMMDEMRNATNIESGLPKELLIDPKNLSKWTIPQVTEHVDKINAWRASQKAEADLVRANNAATVLHKDYPDKGMKWVELKTPEATLPEGYKILPDVSNYRNPGKEMFTMFDDQGKAVSTGATEAEAMRLYNRQGREGTLADALKYEGEQLQHCVGGYCPDVISGKSRIYSLRDAKGNPHATVEVKPSQTLTPEKRESQIGFLVQRLLGEGMSEENALRQAAKLYPESETMQSIAQIKGKGNAAPSEEYLPYVQDFVRSGEWDKVGDLKNTGLIREGDQLMTPNEHADWLLQNLNVPPEGGMKRGGKVRKPVSLGAMRLAVQNKANGGAATYNEAMLRRNRKFSQTDLDQMRLEVEENARRIAAEKQARLDNPPPAEMTEYNPTLQQKLGSVTERGLRAIGAPAPRARALSGILTGGSTGSSLPFGMSVLDFTPLTVPVYGGQGAMNAADAAGKGNYGEAALELGLAGFEMLPGVPAARTLAGAAKPMVKAGAKALAPKMGDLIDQYMMRTGAILPAAPFDKSIGSADQVLQNTQSRTKNALSTKKIKQNYDLVEPSPAIAKKLGAEDRSRRQALIEQEGRRAEAAKNLEPSIGYRVSSPDNPDPLVGTRYKVSEPTGLVEMPPFAPEKHKGANALVLDWDSTGRNMDIEEVSGRELPFKIRGHGGYQYSTDEEHLRKGIAGASGKGITARIVDRINEASKESLNIDGGTGEAISIVQTMGADAERFALPTSQFAFDMVADGLMRGNIKEKDIKWLENLLKKRPEKDYGDLSGFKGFNAEGLNQIYTGEGLKGTTAGNLRKAIGEFLSLKGVQEKLDFNIEDFVNAVTANKLKGIPKGYIGSSVIQSPKGGTKMQPSPLFPFESPYSHDFTGKAISQFPEMINTEALFYRTLNPIKRELLSRENKKPYTKESLRNAALAAIAKRKNNVSQFIDNQFTDDYYTYLDELSKKNEYKKGGPVKKAEGGLAPYGIRHSGEGAKGKGYFGLLPNGDGGYSTELSAETDGSGEYPLLVPTLTREEINYLLAGGKPTDSMYEKAERYALERKIVGKSPFAGPTELRRPLPPENQDSYRLYKKGGKVSMDAMRLAVGGKAISEARKAIKAFSEIGKKYRLSERSKEAAAKGELFIPDEEIGRIQRDILQQGTKGPKELAGGGQITSADLILEERQL